MTLGFLLGSRNFYTFLGFLWSFTRICLDLLAKSCTTTAYRWLVRDSQLSLRTLWSGVIKSPKCAARDAASPLRLLHGALVILVRLQISQFRSLGKWAWTLCLPSSRLLVGVGSQDGSREEPAWEPPCNGISESTKFLQPFRNLRIVTQVSPVDCGLFRCLFGLGFHRFLRSIINELRHWHWRDVTVRCIFPFSNRNFAYCRWRRWAGRRWWAMILLSWRCPWSWWRSRRRTWQARNHDRNEVLRIAKNPNTVSYEMWFLTGDPFVRISVFIANLSERQYCWRVFEDFHSQEYIQFFDVHRCLFMRLQFLRWRLWLS